MSHDNGLLALSDAAPMLPSFAVAMRGYEKRQVDEYIAQLANEISTLTAERERAYDQVQDLGAQMRHIEGELTEMRERPAQVDRASSATSARWSTRSVARREAGRRHHRPDRAACCAPPG